ncbi:MAG: ABC transporter ATP-binding protein [Lachnospiraceae bacterium]
MVKSLKKLARYYIPYRKLFFSDLFFAALGAAVTLAIPLLVRYITYEVIDFPQAQALAVILKIAVVMLGLVLIEWGCNYFITYYGHTMGAYIEHDMRNEIFEHYQKLSFSFYDNQKIGKLLSRITNDLFDITELLHHGPEDLLISVIKLVGSFIILLMINWKMAVLSIFIVVIMLLFALLSNKKMRGAFKDNRARIADINGQIEDSLSGIRVVKSFGNEDVEFGKFRKGNERFVESKKITYRTMALYNSVMNAFTTLITVVSLILGAIFLSGGQLEIPDLVTFLLYISNFIDPVKKLINFTEQFQNGYSGYERFREILEIHPDIEDEPDAVDLPVVQGDIRFDHVSFHYEDSQEQVLNDLNLSVEAGEYVALVGTSGAGKTTLCSLIPRFYEPTAGAIYLDGTDIKKIKLRELRKQIGVVQQDVYLFAGTILENIRYGNTRASDAEVVEAAKAANAHDFIMQMPDTYHTDIGQRGVKLSGGQKQRLSIARVFLKNPGILIFDEATSALDTESEKVVQESLEELAKNRTTFVIAHRLSTIRNARRILVLDEEGIVEEGTHQELLDRNGVYAKLNAYK